MPTMPARTLAPALLLALALAAAACTRQEPKAPGAARLARQELPDDMAQLVPADAIALVALAPIDRIDAKVRAFLEAVEADVEAPSARALAAAAGVDPARVDTTQPALVALSFREGVPVPTFILPVDVAPEGVPAAGRHAAICRGPPAPAGTAPPALLRDMPGGDVALRVDVERALVHLRPMIDAHLSADRLLAENPELARDANTAWMIRQGMDWARELVRSAERFDASLTVEGGRVTQHFALTVLEDSAWDTPATPGPPLADVARSIDARHVSFALFARVDLARWAEAFRPLNEAMLRNLPAADRERAARSMEVSSASSKALGNVIGMVFDLGDAGMRGAMITQPSDVDAILEGFRDPAGRELGRMVGLEMTDDDPLELEGVELHTIRMTMDLSRLLAAGGNQDVPPGAVEPMRKMVNALLGGPGGLRIASGAVGERVLTVFGLEDGFAGAVRAAKARSGGLPEPAAAALGPDASFLLYLDFRRLLAGIVSAMAKVEPRFGEREVAAGIAPIWVRGSQTGRSYGVALYADCGAAAAAVRSLTRR